MKRSTSIPAFGLALGGLLLAVGGNLHPDGSGATIEEHLAEMYASPLWVPAHTLALIGLVVIAVALTALLRISPAIHNAAKIRPFVIAAAIGAVIAGIEFVPHLASSSELDAMHHGGATPLTDLHGVLGIVSTPALGLTFTALAIAVAATRQRLRALWWLVAIPAVLGGIAYAVAGPLIKLSGNPAVSPLFIGVAGTSLWIVFAGIALGIEVLRQSRGRE